MLRASRLLANFPRQRKTELEFLRKTFTSPKNGYPPYVIDKWFRQFEADLKRKPELLTVKTRLAYSQIFNNQGQQLFLRPSAGHHFPPEQCDSDVVSHVSDHVAPFGPTVFSDSANVDGLEAIEDGVVAIHDPDLVTVEDRPLVIINVAEFQLQRTPILITPFVPVLSDQLKKIANKFDVRSWYTFPRKSMDMFTGHRGRSHLSKCRDVVYCAICSCGCQYVGETN